MAPKDQHKRPRRQDSKRHWTLPPKYTPIRWTTSTSTSIHKIFYYNLKNRRRRARTRPSQTPEFNLFQGALGPCRNLSPSCVPVFLTHPLSELPGAGPLAGNSFEFTAPAPCRSRCRKFFSSKPEIWTHTP